MQYSATKRGVCCPGFKAAGARDGKYGVAVIAAEGKSAAAGVFTRNNVKAAPVKLSKKALAGGLSAIVANSGNANCLTPNGMWDAKKMQAEAAKALGVGAAEVAVASTGIIGKPLDTAKVAKLIGKASKNVGSSPKHSLAAAKAIMTTDTKPKSFSVKFKGFHVGGVAKGSGMIAPNMATMLAFITTDAKLSSGQLKKALSAAVEDSFNNVVVDGDESTNDTVLLLSSGRAACKEGDFSKALNIVTRELAKSMARDGEGASKFIELELKGARSVKDARAGVRAILSSPLFKTAVYGENPNWGRIPAKLGSVVKTEFSRADVKISSAKGTAWLVRKGRAVKAKGAGKILKAKEINVTVNLNEGRASATGWGCDLTPSYVKINAGYS